jgi:hypothetical protein
MRVRQHGLAATAMAIALTFSISAGAQGIPCTPGNFGGIMYGIGSSKNNVPFTGIVKSSFEQKLIDGNTIRSVRITHQARDSAGRTMTEMAEGCERGEDGQMHERFNVSVFDPVARTNMNWMVGADQQPKIVRITHQQEFVRPVVRPADSDPAELARRQKIIEASRAQQLQQRKENHIEDLGIRDFNGISAQGTRMTRTIPPSEEGNDLPLVVIDETWRSKETGLTLMAINDDPRRGRSTMEYQELNRGEPEPSLFTPPADYKVEDVHPNNEVR